MALNVSGRGPSKPRSLLPGSRTAEASSAWSAYGRSPAACKARDEVHNAAQDRPDPIWLGHHRREGVRARRAHPARRRGREAEEELSKAVYGTSHTISLAEAKHVYQKGAGRLLIGAGQYGTVALSQEAATYLARHRCQVELLPTPEVIPAWNQAEGAVIAILHVTC
jgi:hypothetical protein